MSRKTGKGTRFGMPSRSPSLESTASASFAPPAKIGRRQSIDKLSAAGVTAYGNYLFDCCSIVVYCPRHNNFAISKISQRKGVWLPYVALKQTEGWYSSTVARLKQLLMVGSGRRNYLSFNPPELIHIFRIQLPTIARFVTRVTYFTQLTHDERNPQNCCQSNKTVQWISAKDIVDYNIADLWGPEPSVFGDAFVSNNVDKGAYTEFTLRDAMKYIPRETPRTVQDEMLKSAHFTEKDIAKVYSEFIQHVYPSQYMVFNSFADYMKKLGWSSNDLDLRSVFRAFSFNRMHYLSFHEFVLGIAAMDKSTPHGGRSGELRCGYIFRFYDANCDNLLDYNEIKAMTYDILKSKNKPCDNESLEKEMLKNCTALGLSISDPLNADLLNKGIGTMLFRGSSALFRCSFSIIQQMNIKSSYDSLSAIQLSDFLDFGASKRPKGTCPRCRMKRYILALHSIKIYFDGTCGEPQEVNQEDCQNLTKAQKTLEINQFSPDFLPNRIMEWIRDFASLGLGAKVKGKKQKDHQFKEVTWIKLDREKLSNAIVKLCQDALYLLQKDGRVIKLNSPAYVLGDIHGNLHDLITYERMLWDKGPACTSAAYLFLGDYVDRGDYGIECVLYLLSCKILNPDKFFLLRGNHELRPIQTVFTFHKECLEKFGKNFGQIVWETCNKVFDCMPLCAIIDDSIFCAHGGIPTSATKIEELYNIPLPLNDPEVQSPPAWEILWNDPVSGNEFGEYAEMLRLQGGSGAFNNLQGFLPNTKRGTAYYFSEEAVSKFLSANGFSHVIRAHEVIPTGYQFHMGGKVITIFSSSKYCGGQNEAAAAFVEQERIRILRLQTWEATGQ
ncbi:Calcineurin-like protein phosphoesterase [Dinothrombium tinctorium]|uniref:Serine/threonine-protein phosphatase n=1 Tax=Dinothrombium tinctorium TaxID=1965070 RepID=A0A3S3P1N8_9ACAR|nr:Calcineurin-like protein phosphoesterase [Dinothrombium tinctorium]RWS04739.1 Calcineurin-like protein phosphoesterase [Dinothrombium tinctorium]RWS04858.1 Calcineurin-like protein phosphoesterase [Dinothrombium tinctorium]